MSYVPAVPTIQVDPESESARRLRWWKRWALRGLIASIVLHLLLVIAAGYVRWPSKQGADDYLEIQIVARPQILMTDTLSLVNQLAGRGATGAVEKPEVVAMPAERLQLAVAPPLVEGGSSRPARSAIDPASLDKKQIIAESDRETVGQPAVMTWGSANALDRLSIEISQILWRRKAVIVWCFEQSPEVQASRAQISANIGRMYADLGLVQKIAEGDVITGVTSFGADVRLQTPKPTIHLNEVAAAINAVPTSAGPAQMCKAVARSISYHQRFSRFTLADLQDAQKKTAPPVDDLTAEDGPAFDRESLLQEERKIVLILVTASGGEPTENQRHLEDTIALARKAGARIYVLGREAMFNYPFEKVASRQGAPSEIYRGADTGQQEVLLRNLFGRQAADLPSGFGPYAQARLVRETGGLFFLVPGGGDSQAELEQRSQRQIRTRLYVPQLESREAMADGIRRSELRRTIMEVVEYLDPVEPDQLTSLTLPNTLPGAHEAFQEEAQKTITRGENIFRYYRRMFGKLEKLAPQRDQEPSRRWQANYDMLRADLATMMARTYEYGVALVGRKKHLDPEQPAPLRVEMRPRQETFHYSNSRRYSELATQLLQRVIDEHPGTPWAARAQAELDRGFGVMAVEVIAAPSPTPPTPAPPNRSARHVPARP